MKNIECINLKCRGLIVNQNKNGERIDRCYSSDGNCRECRYYRDCEWFLDANGFTNNIRKEK